MDICIGKLTIIGSNKDLSPGQHQAIMGTNVRILLTEPLGINFSEILVRIQTFSFKKMHLKMSSGKWRPSCLGLDVLRKREKYTWCCCQWQVVSFSAYFLVASYATQHYAIWHYATWHDRSWSILVLSCCLMASKTSHKSALIYNQWSSVTSTRGNAAWYVQGINHYDSSYDYRKTFNMRHTQSQNLNVSHLVLQLSLPNPL